MGRFADRGAYAPVINRVLAKIIKLMRNAILIFAAIMLLDGCRSAYMSVLPRYTPRMEKGVYPKMPPVERRTFYLYEIYVYNPASHAHYIRGVSDCPVVVKGEGLANTKEFDKRFYQKAYFVPIIYFGHSSMYSEHLDDAEIVNMMSRADWMYIESEIYDKFQESDINLRDGSTLKVKCCIIDGFFWKRKSSRMGVSSLDYLSIYRDIKVNRTSYVIKSLISAKRPK